MLKHKSGSSQDLSCRSTKSMLITLSQAAMARLVDQKPQPGQALGLREVDEVLSRWDVRRIVAPFPSARGFDEPEVLRLARTFLVQLAQATDVSELCQALLRLEAVEAVELPELRFLDDSTVSAPLVADPASTAYLLLPG
jgi:hypothetical protein